MDGDKRSALDHDYRRRQHDRARLDQLHRRTERHRECTHRYAHRGRANHHRHPGSFELHLQRDTDERGRAVDGISIAISVVTGSSCAWTSTSSVASIVVTSGASMSGLGSANFTVAATTSPLTGTLTVAGQIVSITQGAAQPPQSPANLRIISIVY